MALCWLEVHSGWIASPQVLLYHLLIAKWMSAVFGSVTPPEVWLMMVAWQDNKDAELLGAFSYDLNVTRYSMFRCEGMCVCVSGQYPVE